MAKIKINRELLLGKAEIDRMLLFLKENGFEKFVSSDIEQYGIINNPITDSEFDNLRVVAGSDVEHVSIKQGVAVNSDLKILYTEDETDVLDVPTDNVWRYVMAEYAERQEEEGTLNIAVSGQVTGTNTKFTEILRAQPNYPSVIRFPNSTVNTGKYEIITINNDTDIVITGNLQAETGQKYIVVGTFTPDKTIDSSWKDIFIYDSISLSISDTDTSTQGQIFKLALVRSDGATLEIKDVRGDFYRSKAENELKDIVHNVIPANNPLMGLEWIKHSTIYTGGNNNIVKIGFGLVGTTWSFDHVDKSVTVSVGSGGRYLDASYVGDDDFNGWRLYLDTGEYFIVNDTIALGGGVFKVILRQINDDLFTFSQVKDIRIVPNYDRIRVTLFNTLSPVVDQEQEVSIHMASLIFNVQYTDAYRLVRYRYIHNKLHTAETTVSSGGDYLNETSFNDEGVQIASNYSVTLSSARFNLQQADSNFYNKKLWSDRNDVMEGTLLLDNHIGMSLGLTTMSLSPNGSHVSIVPEDKPFNKITVNSTTLESIFVPDDINNPIITMNFTDGFVIVSNATINATDSTLGYKNIITPNGNNFVIKQGTTVTFYYNGTYWEVVSISFIQASDNAIGSVQLASNTVSQQGTSDSQALTPASIRAHGNWTPIAPLRNSWVGLVQYLIDNTGMYHIKGNVTPGAVQNQILYASDFPNLAITSPVPFTASVNTTPNPTPKGLLIDNASGLILYDTYTFTGEIITFYTSFINK